MIKDELTTDDVIVAWTSETDRNLVDRPKGIWRGRAFSDQALKLLAKGKPVSPQQLASATEMPLEEVKGILAEIKVQGGEVDQDGNLVGIALTLNPTSHRFHINGRTLYVWCALDAMFIPGLIEQTVIVKSRCPVTNGPIHLNISPDGVLDVQPATTVISVTIPGLSCRREGDDPGKPETGPASDGCSQMFFFASQEAADIWVQDHPGVAILSVEDAYSLAYANWISRSRLQNTDCCC